MIRPFVKFKPLKPAEGYGRYEFDDLDQLIGEFVSYVLTEEGAIAVEPKWDGIRLVVHYDGDNVGAFTEDSQRDRAEVLPALAEAIKRAFGERSVILDGEILLGKVVDGKFIPAMRPDMMKIVVGKEPITDPMRFMVFDILYLDDRDLTSLPFSERRAVLDSLAENFSDFDVLFITPQRIAETADEVREAIKWASEEVGSEGAMLKSLKAPYELDGRTVHWAKYKRWKSLKCLIIGISKVFPPKIDPREWKSEFARSKTYIFRCAVYGPDGKTLIPIETKRKLTESDLQLRYVEAGEEDPVTGNIATKSEWKGRDDPRLWEMDQRFGHRQPGEFAYGQTYAFKSEIEPQLGQVVEVAPIALNWFSDDDGFVHLTWMHPRVLRVGVDDQSEVANWERVMELIIASGQDAPDVVVVDGKLKLTNVDGHSQDSCEAFSVSRSFSIGRFVEPYFASLASDSDEEAELGTPDKPLPRLFYHTVGVGLARRIAQVAAKCIPEHRVYVELFAGTSPLLRAKPRQMSEVEILVDIDENVVAFLRAIKSGKWVNWKRFDWRPSHERFRELSQALASGELTGNKRLFAWVYTTFYGSSGYGGRHGMNPFFRYRHSEHAYDWQDEVATFFTRCALWEARLQKVRILHMDALDAIREFDSRSTFFFADPPWEFEASKYFYEHGEFDHEEFRELCGKISGKILILSLPGMLSKWREQGFEIRRLTVEGSKFQFMPVASEHGKAKNKLMAVRRIYFVANYELPLLRKLVSSALPAEEDELTHEEQRLLEEQRFGDSWRVVHDVSQFQDGYRAVYMRHYRGLWSPEESEQVQQLLDRLIRTRDADERIAIWKTLTTEFKAVALLEDLESVIAAAQDASDRRDDVSATLESLSTDKLDEVLERIDRLSELRDRVINFVSVHGDLRIQNPNSPKTQLIGLTLMTPAVAIQFSDGELISVLRDKFLEWQEGDRIVAVKKARQPIVWYDVVNRKEPILWSPPQAAGSTKHSWSMFEWRMFMRVWFGIQRPDYHEIFIEIEDSAESFDTPEGKWVARLLEGKGQKVGDDGVFWQFWYPERDGQLPYVLTHTVGQAKKEWRTRKYEYVILNLPVVGVVLDVFPHIRRLLEAKRKARERLLSLDDWKVLEKP